MIWQRVRSLVWNSTSSTCTHSFRALIPSAAQLTERRYRVVFSCSAQRPTIPDSLLPQITPPAMLRSKTTSQLQLYLPKLCNVSDRRSIAKTSLPAKLSHMPCPGWWYPGTQVAGDIEDFQEVRGLKALFWFVGL